MQYVYYVVYICLKYVYISLDYSIMNTNNYHYYLREWKYAQRG